MALRPSGKIIHLEALRGLAAMVVVVHHTVLAFWPHVKEAYPTGIAETPAGWIVNGTAAVYLFFALSGYVLTCRFYDIRPTDADLGWAATKRLPRLMLPAGLSILVGYTILKGDLSPYQAAGTLSGSAWLAAFANAFLPEGFVPSLPGALADTLLVFLTPDHYIYNTSLWTMHPEFLGSLMCFLYMALHARLRRRAALLAVVNLGLLVLLPRWNHAFLPFLMGTLIAQYGRAPLLQLSRGAGIAALVMSLWLCGFGDQTRMTWGAVGLLFTFTACAPLARPMDGPAGRWLGEVSFPLYLVHVHVILTVTSALYLRFAPTVSGTLLFPALMAITLALSLVAAEPFRRLERWWVPYLNGLVRRMRTSERLRTG